MININKGRYISLPTITAWNVDENRKCMLIDLIQRDCQDESLIKVIKESLAICSDTFSHRDGDALNGEEIRMRSVARNTFEIGKRNHEKTKRLMKGFYSIFDQDSFEK
jgi:hypothetical protein